MKFNIEASFFKRGLKNLEGIYDRKKNKLTLKKVIHFYSEEENGKVKLNMEATNCIRYSNYFQYGNFPIFNFCLDKNEFNKIIKSFHMKDILEITVDDSKVFIKNNDEKYCLDKINFSFPSVDRLLNAGYCPNELHIKDIDRFKDIIKNSEYINFYLKNKNLFIENNKEESFEISCFCTTDDFSTMLDSKILNKIINVLNKKDIKNEIVITKNEKYGVVIIKDSNSIHLLAPLKFKK